MPRILIAGCGYVGLATAELFQQNGWEVEGWTASNESAIQSAGRPFPVHAVDLTDRNAVARAANDFDAVIQCASSRGGGVEDYRRIYLESARNLRAIFPQAPLLFTSSTSVYAQTEGEWVTEESAAEPQTETARVLRATEEFVLGEGGMIARLAGIYGPGRSALLRKFLDGTAVLDPNSHRYINQAHRDDIASALYLLSTLFHDRKVVCDPKIRQIFNVSDNHPITQRECYEWLARRFHRPLPPAVPTIASRRRGSSNKRVSSAKLQGFGWSPSYPTFQRAMAESVLRQPF
ncbi:MAG: NAD-dependent epimerase/dehydratase family protein [Chthoniobacterales bacterium]